MAAEGQNGSRRKHRLDDRLGASRAVRVIRSKRPLWVELCRPTDVGQMTAVGATADKSFGSSAQSPVSRHRVRQFPTRSSQCRYPRSAQGPMRGESRRHHKATTKRNARIGWADSSRLP